MSPSGARATRAGAALFASVLVAALCVASIDDDYRAWDQDQEDRAEQAVNPLERAYNEWEHTQAQLADADMTRRNRADEEIKRRLELNSDYARWEADKSVRATQELERKTNQRQAAADELAKAVENERIAKQTRDAAIDQDRDEAEQDAINAENIRIAAEQNLEDSKDKEARAKQSALDEARRKNEAEQKAIADRYKGQAESKDVAFEVTPVTERAVYATTAINIRSGPGTGYEVVGSLAAGAAVNVNGSANRWWRTVDGRFVAMSYTSETKPAAPKVEAPKPAAPKEQPKPEANPYAWTTFVVNQGGQDALDACKGGLTYNQEISNHVGKTYYAIHNHCKGLPILSLKMGDLVLIEGKGVFKVVDSRDVHQGDTADKIVGIAGDILMQTCYSTGTKMRVVGLVKV